MLKVLYKDGGEEKLEGHIIEYEGNAKMLAGYEVIISGRERYDYKNLKLVYDNISSKSMYFTYNHYNYKFYDGYKQLYVKSIRELELSSKFQKLINDDYVTLDRLADWLVINEEEIKNIYNIE